MTSDIDTSTSTALRVETQSVRASDETANLREQLSSLRGLLALSMLMTERRDSGEILHLATTAIPALVSAQSLGAHLTFGEGARWHATTPLLSQPTVRADLLTQLQRMGGAGGEISVAGAPWAWAFGLVSPVETIGFLLVTAPERPPETELLLLRSLAQQTGIALANARLHTAHAATNTILTETISTLRHKTAIHDRFTTVAVAGGGHQGVVDALYELTGLPASIEDRAGRVLASAGAAGTRILRATFHSRRDQVLRSAVRSGHPVRVDDRLLTVVSPHPDVVGVLMLVDPAHLAGQDESVALEHGATVLAIELARLHGLAETELRLGRNLVSDLVSGTGTDAFVRAQALGHDLTRPHRVVVLSSQRKDVSGDDLLLRVRELLTGSLTAAATAPTPLLMQSGHSVVALLPSRAIDADLTPTLTKALGTAVRIGIGGVCRSADDFAGSHREAQLALRLAQRPKGVPAVVRYEDLGVYQLLAESADPRALESFVERWLGRLIDHDSGHSSDLTNTLAAFLETGGNYDATAQALTLGRSTVRYRIRRAQELSGLDLSDPETRFQAQLACRAWSTVRALGSR